MSAFAAYSNSACAKRMLSLAQTRMRYLLLLALLVAPALLPSAAEGGALPQGAADGSGAAADGSGGAMLPVAKPPVRLIGSAIHSRPPRPKNPAAQLPDVTLPPLATETAAARFRWSGEQLFYAIEFLGNKAIKAGLSIGAPTEVEKFGTVIPIQGLAASVGLLGAVYPIRDSALTYLDPATGLPIWSEKVLAENNIERSYKVDYDGTRHRASVLRKRDGETRQFKRAIPSDLHDAFSWFMDLRSQDLSVGKRYEYFVFDGWKLSRLTAVVVRNGTSYCALGDLPSAEVELSREILASEPMLPYAVSGAELPPVYLEEEPMKKVGRAWFGTDERRIPIAIEVVTSLGPLGVRIERAQTPN